MCHVTGGGIIENLPRVLPKHCSAVIETSSWEWPAIFSWLKSSGNIVDLEMYRTFNCGIGMVLCIDESDIETTFSILEKHHLSAWRVGEVIKGPNQVKFVP